MNNCHNWQWANKCQLAHLSLRSKVTYIIELPDRWLTNHSLVNISLNTKVATKIFEDFGGTLCKEFNKCWEPVSILLYTRPGTFINHPLIECEGWRLHSSLIFLILLFSTPNIEVASYIRPKHTSLTLFINLFSRVSPPSFTLYASNTRPGSSIKQPTPN